MSRGREYALLIALLATSAPACSSNEEPVRVVLITVDTLRGDSLGVDAAPAMPNTRAFAARGQRFESFFAATSTTQPTHASLFTGLHPWQTGVPRNGAILDESRETVAECLKARGFATAAVVASFPLHSKFGFAQGFDAYDDDFTRRMGIDQWEGAALDGPNFYSLAESVADRALAQIDAATAERQFFWFHFYDPHDPYGDTGAELVQIPELIALAARRDPTLPTRLSRARELYDRDVAALDRSLDRIYRRLAQDEGEIATHVVLTSDHGESFGEGGSVGHGRRLTREQVQVPLVLVSPRLAPAVRRDLAGSVDVAATVLALAGVDPGVVGGRDLTRGAVEGGAAFGMRRSYAEPYADRRMDGSVVPIQGAWFFALREGVLYAGNAERVVAEDRAGDPAPQGVAEEMRTLFHAFELSLEGAGLKETLDAADLEILRKLGYAR